MKYKSLLLILFTFSLFFNLNTANSKNIRHSSQYNISFLRSANNNFAPADSFLMTKKQFKRLFYDATGYFFDNHFEQALPMFMEILKVDPDNAHINFYVGACYMNLPGDKASAIPFLQKAIKNTTIWYDYDYRSPQAPVFAYFYLATVYRNNYKIGDALVNNKIFKSFVAQDNEELLSQVDREIHSLEKGGGAGGGGAEQISFTKYFNKLLDELIQYDVYIRNPEQDVSWWVNNLEGIKREMFVNNLLNVAYSGTVPIYDENNIALTNDQVKSIGNEPILKRVPTPNPPYNDTIILVENQLNRQLITRIRFLEEWYFDDITMQIGKKVVGYTPLIEEYTEDNIFKGFKQLFTLYFDDKYPALFFKNKKDSLSKANPSLIIKDTIPIDTLERKAINFSQSMDYTTTIKGEVLLTERIRYDVPVKGIPGAQPWVENIEYSKRETFLIQLFDMVSNGLIQTYDIFDDSLSVKQVKDIILLKTDTIFTKSKYPPFRDTIVINTTNNFDFSKVARFRFMEEWYLNEKSAVISKRIVGFAPLIEIFDENKTIKGYTTLFWVYFDKKYPIRLSQRVYNFNVQH